MPPKTFNRRDRTLGVDREVSGVVTSAGATNAGDIPALDDSGRFDVSLLPTGVGADTAVGTAVGALTAGDFVNIVPGTTPANIRRADASTTGKEASGFVLQNFADGATDVRVFFEGNNGQVTAQTIGRVFLSATNPGKATSTPPTVSGGIQQVLGYATSATNINAEIDQPFILG